MANHLNNKNAEITRMLPYWEIIRILIEEDKQAYRGSDFFLRLPNETAEAAMERSKHFVKGFVNFAQDLIKSKGDYVFKKGVTRNLDKVSDKLRAFAMNANKGETLDDVMHSQVSPNLAAYGTVFGVVDKPATAAANLAEELATGIPYLTILDPQQVLDFEWAADGSLVWFRYSTVSRKPRDPFTESKDVSNKVVVTWTATEYFEHNEKGQLLESIVHNFGIVPVAVQSTFLINSNKTLGKSKFFTTADYIITGNNLISVSNNELYKFGSAILLADRKDFSNDGFEKDKDDKNQTKLTQKSSEFPNVMLIDDMSKPPQYLVKDIQVVGLAKDQGLWYFKLAVDNEKSSKTVQNADKAQSGIAKSYDFAELDGTLAGHSMLLQSFEKQVWAIVAQILLVADENLSIQYPTDFDIKDFNDSIQLILDLQKIGYSETGIKESKKRLIPEITTSEDVAAIIADEIDNPVEPESNDPEDEEPLKAVA